MATGSQDKSVFIELEPMVSPVGPASPVLDLGAGVPVGSSLGLFWSREGGFYWLRQLASLRTKTVAPLVMKASGDLQQVQWLLASSCPQRWKLWGCSDTGCGCPLPGPDCESCRGSVVAARAAQAHSRWSPQILWSPESTPQGL